MRKLAFSWEEIVLKGLLDEEDEGKLKTVVRQMRRATRGRFQDRGNTHQRLFTGSLYAAARHSRQI